MIPSGGFPLSLPKINLYTYSVPVLFRKVHWKYLKKIKVFIPFF
jgi:hypothetical protein